MVSAERAVDLLRLIEAAGIHVWVDGGWGIDALLGDQSRDHDDLDLVVPIENLERCRSVLAGTGFTVERDWLPTALAFRRPDGTAVDLHPIEVTRDGGGDQIQRDGRRWHYEPPVEGHIVGQTVLCCSPSTQLAAHLGYQPTDNDFADMARLAHRFGLELPPPYQSQPGTAPW